MVSDSSNESIAFILKVHECDTFLRNVWNHVPNDEASYPRGPEASKLIPVKLFEIEHDSLT
jgi:hypothetical protein